MKVPTRRLLATLSPSSASRASTNPLIPAYAHNAPSSGPSSSTTVPLVPNPALRPPYQHTVDASLNAQSRIKAPLRYVVVDRSSSTAQSVADEQEELRQALSDDASRAELWDRWVVAVEAIEAAKSSGSQVPQVRFQDLTAHLSSETTLQAILQTGSLVVRDVIPDAGAVQLARDVLEATQERDGHAVFWHAALLAIRANASILSSNRQVVNAWLGQEVQAYIQADTVQPGYESSGPRDAASIASAGHCQPPSAHLTLSPSSLTLPPTFAAATYTALAPFFRANKSRISLYDATSYLDLSNWRLITPSEVTAPATAPAKHKVPHLEGSFTAQTSLAPGDILYRAAHQPVRSLDISSVGLCLPLNTITNRAVVTAQKDAFEAGLPPPHILLGDESVALERPRTAGDIPGFGGRRAMGY